MARSLQTLFILFYHILDMFTVEFLNAFLVMVSLPTAIICYIKLNEKPTKSLQSIYMYNAKTYDKNRRRK